MKSNPLALVALISQPFLLAGGDIAMRKMRKMPEQLCSAYQNFTLTLLASVYLLASGLKFDFIWSLSSQAWLYLTLSCVFTIVTQYQWTVVSTALGGPAEHGIGSGELLGI